MRITRAAKVAAFPLIVLALVALVACQGGPSDTKGDKGDKGHWTGLDRPVRYRLPAGPGIDTLSGTWERTAGTPYQRWRRPRITQP